MAAGLEIIWLWIKTQIRLFLKQTIADHDHDRNRDGDGGGDDDDDDEAQALAEGEGEGEDDNYSSMLSLSWSLSVSYHCLILIVIIVNIIVIAIDIVIIIFIDVIQNDYTLTWWLVAIMHNDVQQWTTMHSDGCIQYIYIYIHRIEWNGMKMELLVAF